MKYYFINNFSTTTIYYFLKELNFSQILITKLRKKLGYLKINNEYKRTNDYIKLNETLEIDFDEEICPPNYEPNEIKFNIVYEDDYYLIIDKPSHIATIPTKAHYINNLASAVLFYSKQTNQNFVFRAKNRLDYGTSGIIVIAKDLIAYNLLSAKIEKKYYALVDGKINKQGIICGDILDNDNLKMHYTIQSQNSKIKTHYELLKYYNSLNVSLLNIFLEGGKTNQIRVHMESIGHSLTGDIKYGGKQNLLDSFYLRCYYIKFIHPITKQMIEITLPKNLPTELNLEDLK